MNPFRSAILACLIASTGFAAEPADPVATVTSWIKAVQSNDLATAWDALPEAQRMAWAEDITGRPAPGGREATGPGRGPRGAGGRAIDGPLRMLAEGDQAQHSGRILAATLAALAGSIAIDGKAPPSVALPADQPFLAFVPRMAASGALGVVMQELLASQLETKQIAAIDAWATAYATWAKTAPLADEPRAAAAQPHLQAFAVAVRAVPAKADARAVLVGWSAGLPRLKQALAVYGLDIDGSLASAKVEATPPGADGSVVVLVRFTAFAVEQTLPLKLHLAHGGWEIAADSPALRWLRGGAPGPMMGGRMGGAGQRRQPGGQAPGDAPPDAPPADAPADVPADAPAQKPVGF